MIDEILFEFLNILSKTIETYPQDIIIKLECLNNKYKEMWNKSNQQEKDLILSQYTILNRDDEYTYPLLKMMYNKMKNRYLNFYQPNENNNDILISDIKHNTLIEISQKLFGFEYLEETTEDFNYNIKGKRYGHHNRILFPLKIGYKDKKYNCVFIYDTGSPLNNISLQTYKRIFKDKENNGSFKLNINGVKTEVICDDKDERLEGINIIGDKFMFDSNYSFYIKYSENDVKIELNPELL